MLFDWSIGYSSDFNSISELLMGRWRESNLQIPFIFLFEIKNTALYWNEGDGWEHFMIVEVIWEKRLSTEIWKWVVGWRKNTQGSSRYVRDTKKNPSVCHFWRVDLICLQEALTVNLLKNFRNVKRLLSSSYLLEALVITIETPGLPCVSCSVGKDWRGSGCFPMTRASMTLCGWNYSCHINLEFNSPENTRILLVLSQPFL